MAKKPTYENCEYNAWNSSNRTKLRLKITLVCVCEKNLLLSSFAVTN